MAHQETVTRLLNELKAGRHETLDELLTQIYDELRIIAHKQLRGERTDHTLNTTALVHEVYLKLVDQSQMDWQSRVHFYAVAAQAMRWTLVSYARRRRTEKRGGGAPHVGFDEAWGVFSDERSEELIALDEALTRLEAINPRHARIVECRFFGGLTIKETAEALGVATVTVTRDWRMARAWLKEALT